MKQTFDPAHALRPGGTAVITGAASGFGRELALLCAAEGMRLVLADVDDQGLAQTVALTGLPPDSVYAQRCNVADADDVDQLAQRAMERFGNIHLLFNNAGVIAAGNAWKATAQDWQWVFGVNVMGVANGVRSFVPGMLAHGQPAWVINTASVAGLVCPPQLSVYAASKHAVVALSECLHHELAASGQPVGASVLCPAYVDTGIADAHRHRPPELVERNPDDAAILARTKVAMQAGRLSARDVALRTLAGVREGRFYILPHRSARAGVQSRLNAFLGEGSPDNPLAGVEPVPQATT